MNRTTPVMNSVMPAQNRPTPMNGLITPVMAGLGTQRSIRWPHLYMWAYMGLLQPAAESIRLPIPPPHPVHRDERQV